MNTKQLLLIGIIGMILFVAVGDELGFMSVIPDPNDPVVTVTSHTNGEVVHTDIITISGTASDNNELDYITIDVYQTGAEYRARGTTTWSGAVQLVEGRNTIFVWAKDKEYNTDLAVINIIYTPSISSDVPTDGTTNDMPPGVGFSDLGIWGYVLLIVGAFIAIATRKLSMPVKK